MIYRIIHILLLIICTSTFTVNANDKLDTARVYQVRGDYQFIPFEFVNDKGKADGFNVELLSKLMKHLKLKYELKLYDFDRVCEEIEFNKIDIVTGMMYTPLRAKYVNFGIPHSMINFAIVSNASKPFNSIEELKGKHIIVQNRDGAHDYLIEKKLTSNVTLVDSIPSGLTMINNGEADAMITFDQTAYYYTKKYKLRNVHICECNIGQQRYSIAVAKGQNELLYKLKMGLYQMKISGEYDEIYNKWFGVYESQKSNKRLYVILIITLIIILLIGLKVISKLTQNIKQSIYKLSQNEQRFQILFNSINDAIFLIDPDKQSFCECNKTAVEMFGYDSREELLNTSPINLFVDTSDHEIREFWKKSQTETIQIEYLVKRKNGEPFYANAYMQPTIISGKKYIQNVSRDITERKLSEEKIKRTTSLLYKSLDAGKISIWAYDCKAETFKSLLGETIMGDHDMTIDECKSYLYNETEWDNLKKVLDEIDNEEKEKESIIIHLFINGEHLYFKTIISKAEDGTLVGMRRNITENYLTNKQLEDYRRKTELAIKCSNINQFEIDCIKKTLIRYIKKGNIITELTTTCDEFIELIDPEYRELTRNAVEDVFVRNIPNMDIEIKAILSNSQEYQWGHIYGIASEYDENGKITRIVGFWRNDTEWHNITDELISLRNKTEEANRLKSAFIANMSHEIRTPLNAIVGFSEILSEDKNIDDESRKQYLKIVQNNNDMLLRLINDILDLSRLEAGDDALTSDKTDIDINAMLQEIARAAALRNTNKNVEIKLTELRSDICITSDKSRIMQVINNFINNALKFTEEGSIHIEATKQNANTLCISVTDTGCGIPDNKISSIFERFVKLNTFKQGTGLGLSICKSIAEKLNGNIDVKSAIGEGSTFWITLPIVRRKEVSATRNLDVIKTDRLEFSFKDNQFVHTGTGKRVVLAVEDDLSNFMLIEAILQDKYKLIHAWNGKEAITMFDKYKPDAILMDIKMPIMNGIEATEIIRITSSVPIIAVSANLYDSKIDIAHKSSGFNAFVSKPIRAETLTETLEYVLQHLDKDLDYK